MRGETTSTGGGREEGMVGWVRGEVAQCWPLNTWRPSQRAATEGNELALAWRGVVLDGERRLLLPPFLSGGEEQAKQEWTDRSRRRG